MASNTKTMGNGGNGWPKRWWERMFAVVLVLIAIIAAIILFLVMARGYCSCRTWGDWSAGLPCPEGCTGSDFGAISPEGWNQDALLYCRKQLGSYGSSDVYDLPGVQQEPTYHERYFWYQAPNQQEVYFFLAVQASSYGDPGSGVNGSAVRLDVRRVASAGNEIPVSCSSPRLISETASTSSYGSSDRTYGWYCRVSPPQGGFPGGYGGFSSYRVWVRNISPQPLRYCYVAVCDRKYPKNDKCTDPAVALQIQAPTSRGYGPSPGYSPPYPNSSGYPGSSSYPGPSGGGSYPSSSSSYPGAGGGTGTPGTTSSSPPPSSTGTGEAGGK